jgi:hypothetical protein
VFNATFNNILDLQLPMQSVSITTNILSSNPAHSEMYSKQHYVSSTNKHDRHDITEMLLKVALNTKHPLHIR